MLHQSLINLLVFFADLVFHLLHPDDWFTLWPNIGLQFGLTRYNKQPDFNDLSNYRHPQALRDDFVLKIRNTTFYDKIAFIEVDEKQLLIDRDYKLLINSMFLRTFYNDAKSDTKYLLRYSVASNSLHE